MLRPPIRVARPADWTGWLAFVLVWANLVVLAVVALLARLPAAWVDPLPHPLVLRGAILAFGILVLRGVATLVYTRLPSAAYLSGRTVAFRERGRRRQVHLRDIAAILVDLRPPPVDEMFVLKMQDGSEHDLCPVHWAGAGRLYSKLARRVAPRVRRPDPR